MEYGEVMTLYLAVSQLLEQKRRFLMMQFDGFGAPLFNRIGVVQFGTFSVSAVRLAKRNKGARLIEQPAEKTAAQAPNSSQRQH